MQCRGRQCAHRAQCTLCGGYTLERHGRPGAGFHALQLEFDRSLYLDAALRQPGDGLDAAAQLLADIVAAVGAEATLMAGAIAAE